MDSLPLLICMWDEFFYILEIYNFIATFFFSFKSFLEFRHGGVLVLYFVLSSNLGVSFEVCLLENSMSFSTWQQKRGEKRETDLDLLFLWFIPNYFLQQNLFFFFFFFHLCFDPKSNFSILKSWEAQFTRKKIVSITFIEINNQYNIKAFVTYFSLIPYFIFLKSYFLV